MPNLSDVLPKTYGYVVLAVAGGSLVNVYHIYTVDKARREFQIKAPLTYSEEHPTFNRVMRAHQNYLEYYPFFATGMLLGGLQYPRACASAGLVWLIARVIYADQYIKDSAKRGRGFLPAMLAQLVMLASTIGFGVRHSGILASCRNRFWR